MQLDTVRIALPILVFMFVVAASGCSGGDDRADAETATPAQAMELRSLERPVIRNLKLAFIALSRHRNAAAATRLEDGVRGSRRVTDWLDAHEAFAEQNRDAVECAEHALPELGDLVEQDTSALRRGTQTVAASRRLRVQITEAVNCLQASD